MRAVILAGGKGTRLRPYTVVLPKPLMPVGDYPILEVVVRQLARHGFNHVTMAVNHQVELIQTFFGDGRKWGIRIDYSIEHAPLSTIGPLQLIGDLPEHFLIMNGDVLTDLDFGAFFEAHRSGGGVFTISSCVREHRIEYGVLDVEGGRLGGFREKPVVRYQVSMGVYAASRRILEFIPAAQAYGFDTLMHDLLARKIPVRVTRFDGYWLDIGRPDDYVEAIEQFEKNKAAFLKP